MGVRPPSKELETPPPEQGTCARVERGGQTHPVQGTRASPVLAHLPRSSSATPRVRSKLDKRARKHRHTWHCAPGIGGPDPPSASAPVPQSRLRSAQ